MRPDITWLDVSSLRRSLIGYCLGMAVYTLVVVAMYPAFKTSSSLDKIIASDSTAAALFGWSFQLDVTVIASVSAATFLMGMDFGLVTMAIGALTGRRATALGAGPALAARRSSAG